MNAITSKISMDLMTASKELPVIHAVQGECNARSVQLSLFCGGSPWQIPEGTHLMVRYGRIGQGGGYYDTLPDGSCAYSYEGNTATVMLAPQMMMVAGTVVVQLELEHEDQILVTFSFKLLVEVNPAVGILEQETYINWKQWLEQELDDYVEKINQSGQMLGGTMAGPINMNGNPIIGLNAPTANDQAANMGFVNQQVKKAAPRNLLDNSYFRNPVNQRGKTSYTGTGYTIDRWYLEAANATLSKREAYVEVIPGSTYADLHQNIDNNRLYGQNCTFAIHVDSGVYTRIINFRNCAEGIALEESGITLFSIANRDVLLRFSKPTHIYWVALYEGEYTAETLPEYHHKGYGAELAECLRYFERLGGQNSDVLGNAMYVASGFSSFITSVQFYPKRLPQPTVIFYDPGNYRLLFKNPVTALVYSAGAVESFDEVFVQSPFAQFRVNLHSVENQNAWVTLQRADNATEPFIDISADL